MTNMSSTNDKLQVNFREALTLKKFEFSKTGLTPHPNYLAKIMENNFEKYFMASKSGLILK